MKNLFKENKFIFQETQKTLEVNSSKNTKEKIEKIQKEPNIEKRKKDLESEWSSTLDFPVQINGKNPEEIKILKEQNYFFKMSKYQKKLIKHINDNPDFIKPTSRNLSFLDGKDILPEKIQIKELDILFKKIT